jgi:hypothetical protein
MKRQTFRAGARGPVLSNPMRRVKSAHRTRGARAEWMLGMECGPSEYRPLSKLERALLERGGEPTAPARARCFECGSAARAVGRPRRRGAGGHRVRRALIRQGS